MTDDRPTTRVRKAASPARPARLTAMRLAAGIDTAARRRRAVIHPNAVSRV
jgi:hypothetical protein